MHCGTTFPTEEVEEILQGILRLRPGTSLYVQVWKFLYYECGQSETGSRIWAETDGWDSFLDLIFTTAEVERYLQECGYVLHSCDHWNERSRVFAPQGLGSESWLLKGAVEALSPHAGFGQIIAGHYVASA